jgi:hypothetical protein
VTAGGAVAGYARAFHRFRGAENLFYPAWVGRSLGGEAVVELRPGPGLGALVRGFVEAGDDWRAGRVFWGVTYSF